MSIFKKLLISLFILWKLSSVHIEDVNECSESTDTCDDITTVCVNLATGFQCVCQDGYEHLNSTHCTGKVARTVM